MTEEEAKTKWCPFARVGPSYAGINRNGKGSPNVFCIASACMAWRWNTLPPEQQFRSPESKTTRPVPEHGYCGLAGKSL